MLDILVGYSKALYSTWFYYKPGRLLLDGGEGICQALGKKIFGIRMIFLTHGHEDHIAGLPSLVNLRNLSSGDRELPISIYHPAGDPFIEYMRDYLQKKQSHGLRYELRWTPLNPGDRVDLEFARRPRRVEAFPVEHTTGWQSLGYRIEELRQMPRPDFRGMDSKKLELALAEKGRDAVMENLWHPILVYTGDCIPVEDPAPLRDAEVLLLDSTYLDAGDGAGGRHGNVEASLRTALEAEARHLILFHLSDRYKKKEILQAARKIAARIGHPPRLGFFFNGDYFKIF